MSYLRGVHMLGADVADDRAILIKVRNFPEVVQKQGALASVAQSLLPNTVSAAAYGKMQSELAKALAEKGVQADVAVISASTVTGAQPARLPREIPMFFAGVGAAGVGYVVWRIVHFFTQRKGV